MEKQRWLEKCKEELQVPMAQHDCGTGTQAFMRWPNPLKAVSTNAGCLGRLSERSRNLDAQLGRDMAVANNERINLIPRL